MLHNPAHLVYIVLSPILSTVFALFNIITIYVFCKRFRLSSLTLIVMVNICACDIFVCLVSNTFYLANVLHPVYAWSTGAVSCKVFKFITMLTNIAQIYFLCILNTDRLRRLVNSSSKQWSKNEGIIFVAVGWIAATVICLPRLILYDEKVIRTFSSKENTTIVVSYACKPVGMKSTMYTAVTVATFFVAFAIPAIHILFTLVRAQIFMWQRRKQIHISTTSNAVTRMHNTLSLTFNLTGALFMAVWAPFFVLSLVDLSNDLLNSKEHTNMNFTLRCTLLILGSAKPFIYIICLDKFRQSFICGSPKNASTSGGSSTGKPNLTKPNAKETHNPILIGDSSV